MIKQISDRKKGILEVLILIFFVKLMIAKLVYKSLLNRSERRKASESETARLVPLGPHPVASFSASSRFGFAPMTVKFTDLSKNALEVTWDFGDGATSGLKNPTHTYIKPGRYVVKVTAYAEERGTSILTIPKYIKVLPGEWIEV